MIHNIITNNLLKEVLSCTASLYFDKPEATSDFQSKDLRGAIAGLYPNEILLHQHSEDGTVKYSYPFVQYKNVHRTCMLVGIENGAKLISNLNLVGETIELSCEKYRVLKKDISLQESLYGIIKTTCSYSFLTPWLALNEKNYEQYQKLEGWTKKKEFLEKILIGNIISMSKGLGYTVPEDRKSVV